MAEIFGSTTTTPLNPNMFSGGGSGSVDLSNYYTKAEVDTKIGDIDSALDELHDYAQGLIGGAE